MDIDALEASYTDLCKHQGCSVNKSIQSAFSKAKHLKHLNDVCILEIKVDQITEDEYPCLGEIFSLLEISEIDVVDITHSSPCVIHNGHGFLSLLRRIGPKLRTVNLKDFSRGKVGKRTLRELMKGGLPCQILNLSSCGIKKLRMTGWFSALDTLKLDFNTHITTLPQGCFRNMPKLRRLSLCETRIANLWTMVAALSKLPNLSELRFQKCLCCKDTGICPLSAIEIQDCSVDGSIHVNHAQSVEPVNLTSFDSDKSGFSGSKEMLLDNGSAFDDGWADYHLVDRFVEDSSDDRCSEGSPSQPWMFASLDEHLLNLQQQRDYTEDFAADETLVADVNGICKSSWVLPSNQIETVSISNSENEGFSSDEELISTRETDPLKHIHYISDEAVDSTVSLGPFHHSVGQHASPRSRTDSDEDAFSSECQADGSVVSAGFPFRQNTSHHASPICFEKYYRQFMIASVPHLEVLDNLPVTHMERDRAKEVFAQHFELLPYNRRGKENIVNVLKARETGSILGTYPNKRPRLGMTHGDAISYSRSICAARMSSCAWPAVHSISRLKMNSCNIEQFRPRQFEYHPSDSSLMAFGTLDGQVVVINHESEKIVGYAQSGGVTDSILGLCWLHKDPSKLIAGSDTGTLQLYDVNHMPSSFHLGTSAPVNRNSNPVSYTYEEFEQLTSVHVNATDDYFLASGYSKHVSLYDVRSGKKLQVFKDLHREHINVVKFAHHSPYLFATSSFDKDIKMWDLRQKPTHPLYTATSSRGNVMVCFSHNDNYFLSSAVDNEVKQHLVVDGRLHLKFDIAPTGGGQNYTRSYYMNGTDYVISGSCEENIVRICCSHTGRRLRDLTLEAFGCRSSLYVQSLRGDPFRDFHLSVLAAYLHPDSRSEILKINLLSRNYRQRSYNFDHQYLPLSGMGG